MTSGILSTLTKSLCLSTAVALLFGCGGSSKEDEPAPVVSFVVSATAGTGGSISPASISVNSGQTTSFTVTPADSYEIASVTGCGGSLSANTFTTAAITATCTVTASFNAVSATILTGVFVDSAVENISYNTASQQGQTNAAGEFNYVAGETVTFSLGELLFPATVAKAVLTPIDIVGAGRVDEDAVVNMVRLLLSLDQDGDASNGIQLTDAAAAVASAEIDFKVSIADFAANAAVQTLLSNGGQNSAVTELVSVDTAIAHFDNTLADQGIVLPSIVGAFVEVSRPADEDQSEAVIVVFLEDGSYYLVEINNGIFGNDFEYGNYQYQLLALSVSADIDKNDELGLNDVEGTSLLLTASGFELTAPDVDGAYIFERVHSETNPLIGGWLLEEESVVFVFAADGSFTAMQPFDEYGGIGFEWGTFEYDAQTELISFTVNIDTSGETLTSGGAPQSALVEADTLTMRFSAEEVIVLSRIKLD